MVSEHNLLTATRFRLPQGVLSLRGGGGGGGGGGGYRGDLDVSIGAGRG